jgi:hypothetical protein
VHSITTTFFSRYHVLEDAAAIVGLTDVGIKHVLDILLCAKLCNNATAHIPFHSLHVNHCHNNNLQCPIIQYLNLNGFIVRGHKDTTSSYLSSLRGMTNRPNHLVITPASTIAPLFRGSTLSVHNDPTKYHHSTMSSSTPITLSAHAEDAKKFRIIMMLNDFERLLLEHVLILVIRRTIP